MFNWPVVFLAPSFGFFRLLFALSASLFASSSCGFLSIPFCFSRPFGFAPFLFLKCFCSFPIYCPFLLLHSICFVATFGCSLPSLTHATLLYHPLFLAWFASHAAPTHMRFSPAIANSLAIQLSLLHCSVCSFQPSPPRRRHRWTVPGRAHPPRTHRRWPATPVTRPSQNLRRGCYHSPRLGSPSLATRGNDRRGK